MPFPVLDADMDIDTLVSKMPPGSKLEIDRFNGRWRASVRTPHTLVWKRLSRSWGLRGHSACLREIMEWAWSLGVRYGLQCPYSDLLQATAHVGESAAEAAGAAGAASSKKSKLSRALAVPAGAAGAASSKKRKS